MRSEEPGQGVVPLDFGADAIDSETRQVHGKLLQHRRRDAPAHVERIHEDRVEDRDGLGDAELAVLDGSEHGADQDSVELRAERDVHVRIAHRARELPLVPEPAVAARDALVHPDQARAVGRLERPESHAVACFHATPLVPSRTNRKAPQIPAPIAPE